MAVGGRGGHSDALGRRRSEDRGSSSWSARPGFLAFWRTPHACADGARHRVHDAATELDCLRGVLAPALLRAAECRARELDVGAERVLIQWGMIDEEAYLRRLAFHLDLPLADLSTAERADCPSSDRQVAAAAETGLIPLRQDGELVWVLAPTIRHTARTLCRVLDRLPDLRGRLRLTSAASLQRFLMQQGRDAIADAATGDLQQRFAAMSAAPGHAAGPIWRQRLRRFAALLGLAVPAIIAPGLVANLLAVWFMGFATLRLAACFWPRAAQRPLRRRPDATLPIYTVVAALHREERSVAGLVAAIEALDYPHEKLDVILVIEPNDLATRAAIARLGPRPHLRVLIAPPVAPQTKPKALNCALAFARGSFIAVYDAEDQPEPGQLRAALDTFDRHGATTACAQASLCIDNITHSWLSRTFAAEYAGQFDRLLPGLSEMNLPLPLGGTSNHFRTDVLRAIGGWDPYNVTEDADLGFRLARFGYRSVSFASTTYEEAPITFDNWRRQRARWMKGFIQTWLVHMRHPLRLWRDIGPRGVLALNLIVGGNLLTALVHPLFLGIALASLAGAWVELPAVLQPSPPSPLHWLAIAAGYASTVVVGLRGLAGRRQLRLGFVLLLTPAYWICLSIAAWCAVAHFVWRPYYWEKTVHGVAKRAKAPLPGVAAGPAIRRATNSVSDPRRLLRASASC